MRKARLILLLMVVLAAGCNPLVPAATPTMTPATLADPAMQQAALAAVQDYATRLSYAYRNPSFNLLDVQVSQAAVHVTVSFQTRPGFPYEDYDALFVLRKTATGWQADPIKSTTKLDWEVSLTRGPVNLQGAAGFAVAIPAGWAAYVAPQSELKPASQCGIGNEPVSAVPVLVVVPIGYSAENTPIVLRGYQQCPRAADLSVIRQRLEAIKATDKTINFQRLELAQLSGKPALVAVMQDANGTLAYDYYVVHHDRQLEFVLQAFSGIDITQVLAVLNGMQWN